MRKIFIIVTIGFLFVGFQSCGENNGGGTHSSCSCLPRIGHEARSTNLNFQETDITGILKFIGYYGIAGEYGSCCGPYGKDEVTGFSANLNLTKAVSNRYADYTTDTNITFGGFFLPKKWTLQLWLNPSAKSSGFIMEENINERKAQFLSMDDKKKLSLNLPPSDNSNSTRHLAIDSSGDLPADLWQHVAITVSENNVTFFINGKEDKRQSYDGNLYNNLEKRSSFSGGVKKLCFGSCQPNADNISFQGKIDNIEFINRLLSAGEIKSNYEKFRSTFQ